MLEPFMSKEEETTPPRSRRAPTITNQLPRKNKAVENGVNLIIMLQIWLTNLYLLYLHHPNLYAEVIMC
jgi:hypothetical protein